MASATLEHLGLSFRCDHYYLKRSRIVERIRFDNRTFYAKFERIDETPTDLLLTQHLHGEYVVALPLLNDNRTDYIVFEYKGEETQRFVGLLRKLLEIEGYTYRIFYGKNDEKIQCFVSVPSLALQKAHELANRWSQRLAQRFTKRWKTLPDLDLPDAYNIVTLPYREFD